MHTWYWLADACRHEQLPFALGHAFGMKAVHQSKTKSDAHDAEIIARLLRGGNFPLAYAYPAERRGLRDLLRTDCASCVSGPNSTTTSTPSAASSTSTSR